MAPKIPSRMRWERLLARWKCLNQLGRARRYAKASGDIRSEEGATIVATALASTILLCFFIGVFEMSLALYNYHLVCDAAREATRYAIVRGSASCTNSPNLSNCNATSAEIQSYVQGLGYPNSGQLAVTTTWLSAVSSGSPATTTWSACSSGTCNAPGNLVNVVVTEAFPLNVPFISKLTLNLSSTSQMVISQ
jgi:Flp pilus assembly protein TadG